MTLNDYRDKAYKIADDHGFHNDPCDFATRLMLIVSELSEAMEADRNDKWAKQCTNKTPLLDVEYRAFIKGTVEEEIADAFIRLLDLAGIYNIDLDWHVKAKMEYNKTREYKHGKELLILIRLGV